MGGAPAQPGASAPGAKHAPDRARGIIRDLRSRQRWVADAEAFNAVRSFRSPPSEGETPSFPVPSPSGAPEELLAPPAAGPTALDRQPTDAGALVGNAHSSLHQGGAQAARSLEPPKAPPLAPLVPGTDLYADCGIKCHLARTDTVPTGDPATRKGRSRLFPSVFEACFEEATIKFEMIAEASATPTSGWGPQLTIESTQPNNSTEVVHGHGAEFVVIDYPNFAPDLVAIHRAGGARLDAAGTLFVEFPAGAGLQLATWMQTFVHLPGALPARLHPTYEDLMASGAPNCRRLP